MRHYFTGWCIGTRTLKSNDLKVIMHSIQLNFQNYTFELTCEPTELEGEIDEGVLPFIISPLPDLKNSVQVLLIWRQ